MPGAFPNPPAAQPGSNVGFAGADTSEFDSQGIVRFNFTIDGKTIGFGYLNIKVRRACRDANFWWVPWKDCRPLLDVVYDKQLPYVEKGATYNTWYTFHVTKSEPSIQPTDKSCRDYDLAVTIGVRTALPDVQATADTWIGKGELSSRPLATWRIPIRLCCRDCDVIYAWSPPDADSHG